MEKLFECLVNDNSDQWNEKMAIMYSQSIPKLMHMFKQRDTGFITESSISLTINKDEINKLGNIQLLLDKDYHKDVNENGISSDNILISTIVEKFCTNTNDGDYILEGIVITGKVIVGIDFTGSQLDESYFTDCIFYGCKLSSSFLNNIKFTDCVFNTCEFDYCDLNNSLFSRCRIYDCSMTFCTFDNSLFSDCLLIGVIASNSSFYCSKWLNTAVTECDLIECNWSESDLTSVSINICDMSLGNYEMASFVDCMLININISESQLNSIILAANTMIDVEYDKKYDGIFDMDKYQYSPSINEWEPFVDPSEPPPTMTNIADLLNGDDDDYDDNDLLDDPYGYSDNDKPWLK